MFNNLEIHDLIKQAIKEERERILEILSREDVAEGVYQNYFDTNNEVPDVLVSEMRNAIETAIVTPIRDGTLF